MVRFVVLAFPRTGSTLLITSLAQHPRLKVYNEIFSPTESDRQAQAIGGRWYREGEDGAAYLREVVFAPGADAGADGVGFKLMSYDLKDEAGRSGWQWLADERELRVIALVRRDLLATLVSNKVGAQLGRWHRDADDAADERVPPFRIEVAECRAHFAATAARQLEALSSFAGHPITVVDYARDLAADFPGTMARLFRFLDVEPVTVAPRLRKLASRPPSEQVSNYDELKAVFADSVWGFVFGNEQR